MAAYTPSSGAIRQAVFCRTRNDTSMEFKYFSHNGEILPIEQAVVPLSNIEYAYGFGVYESIRVANGVQYFVEDHIGRLMESARIIKLEHPFSPDLIRQSIVELLGKNETQTC